MIYWFRADLLKGKDRDLNFTTSSCQLPQICPLFNFLKLSFHGFIYCLICLDSSLIPFSLGSSIALFAWIHPLSHFPWVHLLPYLLGFIPYPIFLGFICCPTPPSLPISSFTGELSQILSSLYLSIVSFPQVP